MVSGADSFLLYLIWWFQPTMSFMQVTVTGFNCSIKFCLLRAKPKSSSTFSCRPKTQKSTICFLVCSPSRQKKKLKRRKLLYYFCSTKVKAKIFFRLSSAQQVQETEGSARWCPWFDVWQHSTGTTAVQTQGVFCRLKQGLNTHSSSVTLVVALIVRGVDNAF